MRIQDVDFYTDRPGELDRLTVITDTPQTNCNWLFKYIVESFKADSIELDFSDFNAQLQSVPKKSACIAVKCTEQPVLSGNSNSDEVMGVVLNLLKTYEHVVVCVTLSDALVDPQLETGQQLARLATNLLYESQLVLQLQPLLTGRARDITGRLIVARGPNSTRPVRERELFYFVQRTVELRECT